MNSRSMTRVMLILIVVAGLAIDAYVHFHLASAFKNNKTSTLSEEMNRLWRKTMRVWH